MGVIDTRLDRLAAEERAEIEEILAEARAAKARFGTARFVSDEGDTMAWYLLLLVAAMAGIIAFFVVGGLAEIPVFWSWFVMDLPATAIGAIRMAPHVPGLFVAVIVALWVVARFVRRHGRHGWIAASFAFVRIRGSRVRLVRYREIKRLEKRMIPDRRRRFAVIEIEAGDGTKLTSYAGKLFEAIRAKLPATASVFG